MVKPEQPVAIKCDANRRLYHAGHGIYVSLAYLAGRVKDGEDFAVYDATTGADITCSIKQIGIERAYHG